MTPLTKSPDDGSACIFCQIAAGHAPANIIDHDHLVTVFHDIRPITPIHILIIPNRHIATLNDASDADQALLGHLILKARQIATKLELDQSGYRLVINTGDDAGQTVYHLHVHLLGGACMPFHFGGR